MKKSLTINATRAGKKVAKNIGFVNPNVANSLVGSAAQMFNALSNDTFVNSEVVKVMDTNEEEQSTTPAPAATKTEPELSINSFDGKNEPTITYNGDGVLFIYGEYISGGYAVPIGGDLYRSEKIIRNFYERLPEDATSATLWVHATEGTNYAAKTVSATCTF